MEIAPVDLYTWPRVLRGEEIKSFVEVFNDQEYGGASKASYKFHREKEGKFLRYFICCCYKGA